MQQVSRCHVPASAQNALRIASGWWLFDQADYAAVLYLNDLFINDLPFGMDLATVSSNLQFKNGLRPSGTVTGYAKMIDISRAKITMAVRLDAVEYKQRESRTILEGTLEFALINRESLSVIPIPKEIVKKFKKTVDK